MSRSAAECHLIVPALFEGIAELSSQSGSGAYPALEKYLSRAVKNSCSLDFPHLLADLSGITVERGRDVPIAAMLAAGRMPDEKKTAGRAWVMATPVMLKPDRDRLVLHPAEKNALPDDLIKAVREHFCAGFEEIIVTEQGQWLIRLTGNDDVTTQPLMKVIGMNVDQFLPEGHDRQHWHSLMNEIQMLFHALHTSSYGFNSLWFEGVGQLPDSSEPTDQTRQKMYGTTQLLEPFVRFTHWQNPPVAEIFTEHEFQSPTIVVQSELMQAIQDRSVDAWLQAMTNIDQLVADLQLKLKHKLIDKISLYPLDGTVYELNRSALRRFWLKSKPVLDFVDANQ